MTEIDHNPHEKRPTNRIWWEVAAILIAAWTGYLYFNPPDWWSILLGVATGGALATWAIERTGNKLPALLGGKPSDRGAGE